MAWSITLSICSGSTVGDASAPSSPSLDRARPSSPDAKEVSASQPREVSSRLGGGRGKALIGASLEDVHDACIARADRDTAERNHRDRVLDRERLNGRVGPDFGAERGRGLGQITDLQEVTAKKPLPGLLVGHATKRLSLAKAVGREAMRIVEVIKR